MDTGDILLTNMATKAEFELIAAGILNGARWIVGPKTAAEASTLIGNDLTRIQQSLGEGQLLAGLMRGLAFVRPAYVVRQEGEERSVSMGYMVIDAQGNEMYHPFIERNGNEMTFPDTSFRWRFGGSELIQMYAQILKAAETVEAGAGIKK